MIENTHGLGAFLIGLGIGLLAALVTSLSVREAMTIQTQALACGTCQEKGKICGEFVCSKDGWK